MSVRFRNPRFSPGLPPFETQVWVTVDSGADVTLIPPQFAEDLGVDLGSLKQRTTGSIERGRSVRVYEAVELLAYLCEEWIPLPVKFYVREKGAAVLGRAGAFEELQIAFVDNRKIMYASRL